MNKQKVWFITGASKGIGLELTKLLLAKGEKVAATSRNAGDLAAQITNHKENFLPVELDITSDEKVKAAIAGVVATFGRIDVVVNNAGFLLIGSMEELTDAEFRRSVDANLFGAVNVIRAVLPYIRAQQSGHIINISSGAGYFGAANASAYNAPKFALVGLTEALAGEVRPYGIHVTLVAPGVFRTNFLDTSSMQMTQNQIDVYQSAAMLKSWEQYSGAQPGDPARLVQIISDIAGLENPPQQLLMGPDVYQWVKDKRKADDEVFETWKHLTLSTNFDNL